VVARLIEGWESSNVPANYNLKWTTMSGVTINTASGRNGQGIDFNSSVDLAARTFDNQPTWVIGAAVRVENFAAAMSLFDVQDAGTTQDSLRLNTDGTLYVRRGASTTLGTSTFALIPNTWYYVEWKITLAGGTSGATEVRVNNTSRLSLSGVNTLQTANAYANTVRIVTGTSSFSVSYDDIYIFDGTGSLNNDFAGDSRVELLLPTGAGATTAWTPSAGANYTCVDEAAPNSDTDYVSSATAGQTDTYTFGNLSVAGGTVKAVQVSAFHRKDDAGSRNLALVARPGSTDRLGTTVLVADSYNYATQMWETNPDTSAAWTVAEVNAAEFGVRLMS
jgi:hypothetical protein